MREAQKLLTASTQHVHMDSQEKLAPVAEAMTQMLQLLKQMQTPPPPDASTAALVQTAMADIQRKAAKDQADIQLDGARLQQEGAIKTQELQLKASQNTENNLTEERIKAAELTRDAAALQQEQMKTAIEAQNKIQSNLGV
jgi:hypothetical protein